MKLLIDKAFVRDVERIKDPNMLKKLKECIAVIENVKTIHDISSLKKLKGFASFYRIKIGDYRLGIELTSDNELILVRCLDRKEIYRYFPKK